MASSQYPDPKKVKTLYQKPDFLSDSSSLDSSSSDEDSPQRNWEKLNDEYFRTRKHKTYEEKKKAKEMKLKRKAELEEIKRRNESMEAKQLAKMPWSMRLEMLRRKAVRAKELKKQEELEAERRRNQRAERKAEREKQRQLERERELGKITTRQQVRAEIERRMKLEREKELEEEKRINQMREKERKMKLEREKEIEETNRRNQIKAEREKQMKLKREKELEEINRRNQMRDERIHAQRQREDIEENNRNYSFRKNAPKHYENENYEREKMNQENRPHIQMSEEIYCSTKSSGSDIVVHITRKKPQENSSKLPYHMETDKHIVEVYKKRCLVAEAKPRIKKDETDVEVLYRNANFVADSMGNITATRTKVTANGEIKTDPVQGFKSRHINADPTLPSLRERTSKSKNTDLYDLSLLLQENEKPPRKKERRPKTPRGYDGERVPNRKQTECKKDDIEAQEKVQKQASKEVLGDKNEVKRKESNPSAMPEQKFSVTADEPSPKKTYKTAEKPIKMVYPRHKNNVLSTHGRKIHFKVVSNTSIKHSAPEKVSNTSVKHPEPQKVSNTSVKKSITPKESNTSVKHPAPEKVSNTSVKNPVPEKVSTTSLKKSVPEDDDEFFDTKSGDVYITPSESMEAMVTMEESEEEDPMTICKPEIQIQTVSVSWAAKMVQNVADLINNNTAYSVLLLFGISCYFWFILYFDVSDYLNEEWRYMSKMKRAGILMKCFYYLMRKMHVPIF
ncbi:apical junction molecule isoform X2 [Drosophila ananassae]|uniref:apical junction molecule isoform X2 n=1 Tax=Drosophila ananassae TaxID=7217 RepID=UPI0013A5D963|nr:apical junction molecule isoform X2 [Drosophila ananassae]